MTHKMLKAARSLPFAVGHRARFLADTKSQNWRQIGTQNKCKTILDIAKQSATMVFSNRMIYSLTD
jgi:hypothetical protein